MAELERSGVVYSLMLYDRLPRTGFVCNLTRHALDWARTIKAGGGYWKGDFALAGATMPPRYLTTFYNTAIGKRIEEWTAGKVTWEGQIVQMDLTINGMTYRRSLDAELWHNKVKTFYRTTTGTTATAYSENTGSSDIYGESVYIDVLDDSEDATSAVAARDRRLTEHAYPRSRPVGGMASRSYHTRGAAVSVLCMGYAHTMNGRFRESDTAAANASAQVSTLTGESEFVTAGMIDTNTLQVPIEGSETPLRLWDGISRIAQQGDASGNPWIAGVYAGRKLHYRQAETAVTHYWRNGRLLDKVGVPVLPSMMRPDIVVEIADVPFGVLPPGGSAWDRPRIVYIDEVEFFAPDKYSLHYTEVRGQASPAAGSPYQNMPSWQDIIPQLMKMKRIV